jgi:hypothetical protein
VQRNPIVSTHPKNAANQSNPFAGGQFYRRHEILNDGCKVKINFPKPV